MTGVDTYYENLGIMELQLDACVCRSGQDPLVCAQICDGTYRLECPPGHVEEYQIDAGQPECRACEPGKYELRGACQFAGSYAYVPQAGSDAVQSCPAHTRVQDVFIENRQVVLRPRKGARGITECVVRCQPHLNPRRLSVPNSFAQRRLAHAQP